MLKKVNEVLAVPSELFIFAKNYCNNSDFRNLYAPSEAFFLKYLNFTAPFLIMLLIKKIEKKLKKFYYLRMCKNCN